MACIGQSWQEDEFGNYIGLLLHMHSDASVLGKEIILRSVKAWIKLDATWYSLTCYKLFNLRTHIKHLKLLAVNLDHT